MKDAHTPKRAPLMADAFVHRFDFSKPAYFDKKVAQMLRDRLIAARRYVFDAHAVRTLAEFLLTQPEVLVDGIDFAIPPFPTTYIEIPGFDALWRAINPDYVEIDVPDTHVGYLFHHNKVYIIADSTHAPGWAPVVSPIVYTLHAQWPRDEQMKMSDYLHVSRIGLDAHLLGSTYNLLPPEKRRILRDNVRMDPLPGVDVTNSKAWEKFAHSSSGDARTAVACLLLLNRTVNIRKLNVVPPKRAMFGNKAATYLAYSEVTFDLSATEVLRRMNEKIKDDRHRSELNDPVMRRHHGVRGHYVIRRVDAEKASACGAHGHVWHEDEEEMAMNRILYRCHWCASTMYWRRAHTRGNKAHGEVTTVTKVTATKEV